MLLPIYLIKYAISNSFKTQNVMYVIMHHILIIHSMEKKLKKQHYAVLNIMVY